MLYFIYKIEQKDFVIEKILKHKKHQKLLDIGCGEGLVLNYYHNKGWDVSGVDYSDFGVKRHHPHLIDKIIKGNIFEKLTTLISTKQQFNVIWLDNVLEHVINPEDLIKKCYSLLSASGVLVIEVPNDYSSFQKELLTKGKVEREYWEAYPDHLNYFSFQSLKELCESNGFYTYKIIAGFPIEWFLTNINSNYVKKKNVGKEAHRARIFIENYLHETYKSEMDNIINLYEAMAILGQGRDLISFFVKNEL